MCNYVFFILYMWCSASDATKQILYSPGCIPEGYDSSCASFRNYYNKNGFVSFNVIGTPPEHNHNPSEFKCDEKQHWQEVNCPINGCNMNGQINLSNHTPKYSWDANQHWYELCSNPNCPYHSQKKNLAPHKFSDMNDTTCDCGFIRTAPAEKPETGDITNIPLWTGLLLAGMALMYVQLMQRKREQY